MTTIQIKKRLAILCVICTLSCVSFLGITTSFGAVALATDYSSDHSYGSGVALISYHVHPSPRWQVAHLDDVFADTVLVEEPALSVPIATHSRQSSEFSFGWTHYPGEGVALISHHVHPLHSNRSLRLLPVN